MDYFFFTLIKIRIRLLSLKTEKILYIQTGIKNFSALYDMNCMQGSEAVVVIIFHLVCCTRFMY